MAFWNDVKAGHTGQLQSQAMAMTADGRLLHVMRRISPLSWRAATATHYLVVVHDRSEQLREQLDRETLLAELQATLESTADGILVTDLAGPHPRIQPTLRGDLGSAERLLTGRATTRCSIGCAAASAMAAATSASWQRCRNRR